MNRNSALDVTKCVAVMSVVLIHATAPIGYKGINTFWNYDWYRSLLDFSVPFFFAAAGFVLFRKTAGVKGGNEYIWKYSLKVLRYYVMATIMYIAFGAALIATDRLFLGSSARDALSKLIGKWTYTNAFNGSIGWYHLYFLAALFGGCLILIALRFINRDPRLVLVSGLAFYLMTLIGYVTIDEYFNHGGLLKGFFYLAIGYFAASLDPRAVRRPGLVLIIAVGAYYLSGFFAKSIVVLPLAVMTGYLVVLCSKYPSIGQGSVLAKWGSRSLEIFIFHDMSRVLIERVFIYAGVVEYFRSPLYYLVAIPFSFLFPFVIWHFVGPLFRSPQVGDESAAIPAV